MRAANAHRIEAALGCVAAGSFAAAVGFSVFQAVDRSTDLPVDVALAALCALAAYPVAFRLLRLLEGQPAPFSQPHFDTVEFEPTVALCGEELVLTGENQLVPAAGDDPLMLVDVLAEMSPESRVVQLFDAAAMPTPRQLRSRIDRHLVGGGSHSPSPDASEALFAALEDLRRSLR